MACKGMTAEAVKKFKKPTAKKKARAKEREYDEGLEKEHTAAVTTVKRERQDYTDPKSIGAGALRGVMDETITRVYEEIWPGYKARTEDGEPNIEIKEESYILSLTMVCGNQHYLPRKGLKMREAEISDSARYCREHRD